MKVQEGLPAYHSAGLQVAAVSMGSASRAHKAKEKLGLSYPLLCDPRRESYRLYGLLSVDPRKEISLRAALDGARAVANYGIGSPAGEDPGQLGGAFVVSAGGILLYAHRATFMADLPSSRAIISSLQLTGRGA